MAVPETPFSYVGLTRLLYNCDSYLSLLKGPGRKLGSELDKSASVEGYLLVANTKENPIKVSNAVLSRASNIVSKFDCAGGIVSTGTGLRTGRPFLIPSVNERGKLEPFSKQYYAACAAGGLLCCGLTHTIMTPVDVVKCNMQIDPEKYKSIIGGFRRVVSEEGVVGLTRGWAPTLVGYSLQGAGKYGFYEFFKKYYSDLAGPEFALKYKTLIYLAGSGSAEFLADIALCPLEAVKVRVQTQPGYAKGLIDGLPKIIASDGVKGLYKGLVPLWGRQIPYTMMKFSTFEGMVEYLYQNVVHVPKDELGVLGQLSVSFAAGYVAGIACAIISHPADNLVSYLNNAKGATVSQAFKDMGTVALFTRGLPLRIFMIGTLTAAQWLIYDMFKVYAGLPTSGGPAVGNDET